MIITEESIDKFRRHMICEEKSESTQESYIRSVTKFWKWVNKRAVKKELVLEFKGYLLEIYQISTANAILSAINAFFEYCGESGLKVKAIKKQKKIFCSERKELTKAEYELLLRAAHFRKDKRLYYILQTICATGIRVSELRFITAEAVVKKYAEVRCKGKNRTVILPDNLCKILKEYMRSRKIVSGVIFRTRGNKPVHRSNIWHDMKQLCEAAGVSKDKVFPHNLRHLFARMYYSIQKDIVRLADILGHASINTTRIYTMETGEIHRRQIQELGFLRC